MALMADPGPGAEGETAGVPNPIPTDAVGLAWSGAVDREDGGDSPTGLRSEAHSEPAFEPAFEPADTHQSWRAAWGNAVLLLAAGLVLAGVIVMGGWALASHSESKQAKATSPPPTATSTNRQVILLVLSPREQRRML